MYTYDGIGSHERVGYSCQVVSLCAFSSARCYRAELDMLLKMLFAASAL